MRGERSLQSRGGRYASDKRRGMQGYEMGEDYILRKRKKKKQSRRVLQSFRKRLSRVRPKRKMRYKRGKSAIPLILIAAVLIAFLFSKSMSSAQESSEQRSVVPQRYYKSITVKNGDTLWEIAERYLPEDYESLEEYIYTLMRVNNLRDSRINAGQQIIIVYNNTNMEI